MKSINKYRLRKCTDINIELPFFEVLDEEDVVLIDISKNDKDEYEILFHDGCLSRNVTVDLLVQIVNEAKALISDEQ